MPGLANIIGLLERLESDRIAVDQNRCVVVRNRNVSCRRCAETCTSGCLSVRDGRLEVSPEACIGCGTCATLCPTGALEPRNPSDAELHAACDKARMTAGGHTVIACERALDAASGRVDPARAVGVACLGRVDESLLAAQADAGARSISLVSGLCAECDRAPGGATARRVVECANTLLATWGFGKPISLSQRFPSAARRSEPADCDDERRRFFATLKDEALTGAAAIMGAEERRSAKRAPQPLAKVGEDGTLPHAVPRRRIELLDTLRRAGAPEDTLIETRLWGHVVIDRERCASCRMCATFCPTGALSRFDGDDGAFGLVYAPSLCVKCRACEDICPENALSLSDEVFAVDLAKGYIERYDLPKAAPRVGPHSAVDAMRRIFGTSRIYER